MESVRIRQGDIERIEAYFVNTASVPLTGLNPTLTIRRYSDKYYWAGNQDFTSAFTQVAMSAVDSSYQGGYYVASFDTTGLSENTYSIIASGTGAGNSPQTGEIKCGYYVQNIDKSITEASNAIGGGTMINLEGMMDKSDKKQMMASLDGSFKNLLDALNNLNKRIDFLNITASIEKIKTDISNLSKIMELQIMNSNINEEISHLEKEVFENVQT